jgi:SAM-dependent methyltransferase
VVGIDLNDELLRAAEARKLPNAEFRRADLSALDLDVVADGIWSSFAAAYFPDLSPVLAVWGRHLRPEGWIALIEIDDLFGHAPQSAGARELFADYARDALASGRYDFHMGGKLARNLERAGFRVANELTLDDPEFSGTGPAPAEVVDAWRARFDRMSLLRDFAGERYASIRDEFLRCLADPRHHTSSRVQCVIAMKDER